MRDRLLSNVVDRIRTLVSAQELADLSDQELLGRFVTRLDEAAFALLVDRYAGMVLGVCRRIVKDVHDAEDACQAVFLALARQAASIRKAEALGGWLQRVAYHVALRAKNSASRSRGLEIANEPLCQADAASDVTWREALGILDEEVSRLPRTYRAAIVLCYLDGRTQDEAARQLGWTLGTLRGRLERGCRRLRERLLRRGVGLPAVLLGAALASQALSARALDIPVTELIKAAKLYILARQPAAITIRVAALAEGVTRAMLVTKMKIGSILIVALGVLAAGASIACRGVETNNNADVPVKHPTAPSTTEDGKANALEEGPARKDIHGDPLPSEALTRLGTIRFRTGTFASGLMYTPDGKVLVSHGWAGAVCIWDAGTGREIGRITGSDGKPIHSATLSPDGKVIAVLSGNASGMVSDVAIELWDRVTHKPMHQFGKGPYAAVRFSPDGSTLAVVRFDGRVELWEVRNRRLLRGWKAHDHPTIVAWGPDNHLAWSAFFVPGSKTLVTAHPLEGIRVWDVASGSKLRELSYYPQPDALALSADGTMLAVGTRPADHRGKVTEETSGRIRLVDLATGKELRQLSAAGKTPFGARLGIRSVALSRDGKNLAARGADGYLRVWDVATGKELHRWWNAPSMPRAVTFSPDGTRLAASSSGAIRLIDLASGKDVGPPLENGSMHAPVAFSPDGQTAITLGHRTPLLWETTSGRLRHRLEGHGELAFVYGLTVSGNTLFTWGDDKKLLAWDLRTGKSVRHALVSLTGKALRSVVASPDGKRMAVWFHEPEVNAGQVMIVDVATGKEVRRLSGQAATAFGGALHPDGRTFVTWGADGGARVWDLATGRQCLQIPFVEPDARTGGVMPPPGVIRQGRFYSAALSPDGTLLAFGGEQRFVAIHDLATGRQVRRVDRLADAVGPMVFSADAHTLIWAGKTDPTVRLIEVASGKERHRFTGHRGSIWSLAVSTDGRRLLSGSIDTAALVWDLVTPLKGQTGPLTVQESEACWADLSSNDAARAYQAVRRLAGSPARLRGRLKPAAPVDETHLARLIRDLDGDDFARRKKASEALEALGEGASAACRKALEGKPSLELYRRLTALADKQAQAWWDDSPDRLRQVRVIEALELAGSPEARKELEKLARGAAGFRLTEEAKSALGRLDARRTSR